MTRKLHARGAAAAVLLLALAHAPGPVAQDTARPAPPQPWLDTRAPDFELGTTAGDTVRLADLRGRLLVIHFGASW